MELRRSRELIGGLVLAGVLTASSVCLVASRQTQSAGVEGGWMELHKGLDRNIDKIKFLNRDTQGGIVERASISPYPENRNFALIRATDLIAEEEARELIWQHCTDFFIQSIPSSREEPKEALVAFQSNGSLCLNKAWR